MVPGTLCKIKTLVPGSEVYFFCPEPCGHLLFCFSSEEPVIILKEFEKSHFIGAEVLYKDTVGWVYGDLIPIEK